MMILYGNIRAVKFFSLWKLRFHSKKPLQNALVSTCKYKGGGGFRCIFPAAVHVHYLFNAANVRVN
jgi:hypothetical protein